MIKEKKRNDNENYTQRNELTILSQHSSHKVSDRDLERHDARANIIISGTERLNEGSPQMGVDNTGQRDSLEWHHGNAVFPILNGRCTIPAPLTLHTVDGEQWPKRGCIRVPGGDHLNENILMITAVSSSILLRLRPARCCSRVRDWNVNFCSDSRLWVHRTEWTWSAMQWKSIVFSWDKNC